MFASSLVRSLPPVTVEVYQTAVRSYHVNWVSPFPPKNSLDYSMLCKTSAVRRWISVLLVYNYADAYHFSCADIEFLHGQQTTDQVDPLIHLELVIFCLLALLAMR